jgi:hypothetical protein
MMPTITTYLLTTSHENLSTNVNFIPICSHPPPSTITQESVLRSPGFYLTSPKSQKIARMPVFGRKKKCLSNVQESLPVSEKDKSCPSVEQKSVFSDDDSEEEILDDTEAQRLPEEAKTSLWEQGVLGVEICAFIVLGSPVWIYYGFKWGTFSHLFCPCKKHKIARWRVRQRRRLWDLGFREFWDSEENEYYWARPIEVREAWNVGDGSESDRRYTR